MFRLIICASGCVLALAACSSKKAERTDEPAPTERVARVFDAVGEPLAQLHWLRDDPQQCAAVAGDETTIARGSGGLAMMGSDQQVVAVLEPGATGDILSNGSQARIARVVTEQGPPRRISVLDADGIALFRLRADGDRSATLLDKASVPAATVTAAGDRLVTKSRDDTITAYVLGTDDAMVAGLLTAGQLDLPYRLLLACDHVLHTPPTSAARRGSTDAS